MPVKGRPAGAVCPGKPGLQDDEPADEMFIGPS